MPRLAASLVFMFQEFMPRDRLAAARGAGFRYIEHQNPYDMSPEEMRDGLIANDLKVALINAPAGDPEKGERGIAATPGREMDFRDSFVEAMAYARAVDAPIIHVMSGIVPEGEMDIATAVYAENMRAAARAAAAIDLMVSIEPINGIDIPGYLVQRSAQARALISMIGEPNVGLQYDAYHALMNGEDPHEGLRANLDAICHVQIAGFPGRNEPDTGEFDVPAFIELCDTLGYAGQIGCEYHPAASTVDGLAWAQVYGIGTDTA